MQKTGKIFFAADFHLGLNAGGGTSEREKRVVEWLDMIAPQAGEIYLLGDVFDFWWEYKKVVPKGFTRFLGKISEITDSGIPVHLFTGNHDMWAGDYLRSECGMSVTHGAVSKTLTGRKFHLAHGEGLGNDGIAYHLLLMIFRSNLMRSLWAAIHPGIGMALGQRWSLSSRLGKGIYTSFMGEEKEDLIRYAKAVREKENIDFFIFGHRHLPMQYQLKEGPLVVILGDWIKGSSYVVWDGNNLELVVND